MNSPARQGTGPSRETLFITRRGGAEGLYVIKRDIPCFFPPPFFPLFFFIHFRANARPRGHAFARSARRNEPCGAYRVADRLCDSAEIESAG